MIDWVRISVSPPAIKSLDANAAPTEYGAVLLLRGEFLRYRRDSTNLGLPELEATPGIHPEPDTAVLSLFGAYLAGGAPLDRLLEFSTDKSNPDAARVFASILASSICSDRRDLRRAIDLLEEARRGTRRRVNRAWLVTHVGYRLLEMGQVERARDLSREVAEGLAKPGQLGEAEIAIRSVADANYRQASWMMGDSRPMLDWPQDRSSVSPIRQIHLLTEDALSAQLQQQFKSTFESPYTRTISFSSEDPVVSPLSAALLRSDLLADWGGASRIRGLMAKYQLLTSVGRPERPIGSALMLLSRARDHEGVTRALRVYRLSGPLNSLRDVGESVATLPWPLPQLKSDLRILGQLGHLLSPDATETAASRLLAGLESAATIPAVTGRLEEAWLTALAALLPGTSRETLASASDWLRSTAEQSQDPLLLQSMRPALESLSWIDLPPREIEAWLAFLEEHLQTPTDRQFVAIAAAPGLATVHRAAIERLVLNVYRSSESLLHAALVMDISPYLATDVLRSIGAHVAEAVSRTRQEAREGHFSYGTVRSGRLLASVAQQARSRDLWGDVLELIADNTAPAQMRADALAAMALRPSRTPKWVQRAAMSLDIHAREDLPFESPTELEGAWLRFRGQFALLGGEELLAEFMALAATRITEARIEAAKSISSLRTAIGLETLAATSVMLSYDPDPEVRALVARELPSLLKAPKQVGQRIVRRVLELLRDPGDYVPAAALAGLAEYAPDIESEGALERQIEEMQHHMSRHVRRLAADLTGKTASSRRSDAPRY